MMWETVRFDEIDKDVEFVRIQNSLNGELLGMQNVAHNEIWGGFNLLYF